MPDSKKLFKNILTDLVEVVLIGAAVFAVVWLFLAEPIEVSGDSMEPTLSTKEQIIVEKVSLNFGEMQRGDIVVFYSPQEKNKLLVKRIVALPGDIFSIEQGSVLINGKILQEGYLREGVTTKGKKGIIEGEEVEVPTDTYVLLGDNRENSSDSREFGLVKKSFIVGKAVAVYYPVKNVRVLEHN